MTRCAYCLAEHSRRGACCCPEHTRKIAAHRAACAAGRNRARAKLLAHAQARARRRTTWRKVALGQLSIAAAVQVVFGVPSVPPMRDPAA